jgi:EAL domain-containing protein (putative c-di-GMP-specific phosphodiesterase class I)
VEIARQLGKRTVAEFVEDQRTLDELRSLGVDYAQGYYIGRPGPLTVGDHKGAPGAAGTRGRGSRPSAARAAASVDAA